MRTNVKEVAIHGASPALVTMANVGDQSSEPGLRAWDELLRAALSSALVGRAACIVEERQTGPLLSTSMTSTASAHTAESGSLKATCLDTLSPADVSAVVESAEFEGRWLWIVVTRDPSTAIHAAHSVAKAGDAIAADAVPTTNEVILSRYDGTEILWLNPPAEAVALLSDAASHSGWRVASVTD